MKRRPNRKSKSSPPPSRALSRGVGARTAALLILGSGSAGAANRTWSEAGAGDNWNATASWSLVPVTKGPAALEELAGPAAIEKVAHASLVKTIEAVVSLKKYTRHSNRFVLLDEVTQYTIGQGRRRAPGLVYAPLAAPASLRGGFSGDAGLMRDVDPGSKAVPPRVPAPDAAGEALLRRLVAPDAVPDGTLSPRQPGSGQRLRPLDGAAPAGTPADGMDVPAAGGPGNGGADRVERFPYSLESGTGEAVLMAAGSGGGISLRRDGVVAVATGLRDTIGGDGSERHSVAVIEPGDSGEVRAAGKPRTPEAVLAYVKTGGLRGSFRSAGGFIPQGQETTATGDVLTADSGSSGLTVNRFLSGGLSGGAQLSAIATWSGAGADNNLSTAANWGGTAPAAGDSLTFAGSTRLSPVNNYAARTGFAGITFSSGAGAFTLSGNTIALTGNVTNSSTSLQTISLPLYLASTVTFDAGSGGGSMAVSGVISGAGGVTKTGSGTLTLSGASTFTGAVTVNAGTLKAGVASVDGSSGAFGRDTAVTLANTSGVSMDITGFNTRIGSLTGGGASGGNVTLGAATLTVGGDNTSPSAYAGVISGTGGLTKIGTGTLTLTGVNTYSGATTVNRGTLLFSGAGSQTGTSALTMAGGTLTASRTTGTQTFNGLTVGASNSTVNNTVSGTTLALGGVSRTAGASGTVNFATTTGAITTTTANTNGILGPWATLGSGASLTYAVGAATAGVETTITGATFSSADTTGGSNIGQVTVATTNYTNGASATVNGSNATRTGNTLQMTGTTAITLNIGNATNTLTLNGLMNSMNGADLTISGGALLAGSTGELVIVANAQATTISSPITSGAVTYSGAGTLTLSGNNTYTGATTVNAGTLALGASTGLGAGGALNVNGPSAVLSMGTNSETVGTVTLRNGGTISGTTGVLTGTSYALEDGSVSAILGGAVAMTKSTAGTVALSGTNTYTGTTTISAGTLNISSAGALGTVAGATSVTAGATLEIQGGITTLAEPLTLNGTGMGAGGALANVSGSNTYAGAVTLGSDSVIAARDVSGSLLTLSSTVALGANTLTAAPAGTNGAVTLSGVVSGTGGVTKAEAGVLTLSAANTYTGATTINAGTLKLGAAGGATNTPLGTTAAGTVVNGGGALDLAGFTLGTAEALTLNGTGVSSGGALINSSATAATYSGLLTLGSNSSIVSGSGNLVLSNAGTITGSGFGLTLGGTTAGSSVAGIIGTGSGGVTKEGSGTWTLSGASTYTGATTVSAGTLKAGVASVANTSGAFGLNSAVTMANASGAVLDITGFNTAIGSLTGGGASGGNVTLGAATLTVGGDNTSPAAYAGVISGTGGLSKTGNGTQTLSGSNTYSGATAISGGVLAVSHAAALGTTAGGTTVNSGGALAIDGGLTVSEPLTLNGGTLQTTVTNTSAATYSGAVGLTAASTIQASASNPLTVSSTIDNGGFDLRLAGATATTLTASNVISGSGSLTKAQAGTVLLSGANTFTGGVTIEAGTLRMGNAGALNATAGSENAVTYSSGSTGVLQLNGNSTVISSLATNATPGTPVLENASATPATLTVGNASNLSSTYAGVIQDGTGGGALSFRKAASGTLVLSGANTYTGTTTVTGGILRLSGSGTLGGSGSNVTVASDGSGNTSTASLDLNGVSASIGSLTFGGASSGPPKANTVTTGAGTLTLGGGVTLSDTTAQSGSGISGNLNLGAATRTFDIQTYSLAVSAAVSGNSGTGLTKTGSGTLVLSGTNTFNGTTTLNGGTLQLGSSAALGAAGNALTLTTGTLDLASASSVNAYNTTVGGDVTIHSDKNTASAGITHTLGTLSIGASLLNVSAGAQVSANSPYGLTFGATTLSAAGAVFDVAANGTGSGTLTLGALSGNQDFTKQGAGTLVLNASSSRSAGNVNLKAGTLTLANTAALGTTGATVELGDALLGPGPELGDEALPAGPVLDLATDSTVNAHNVVVSGNAYIAADKATASSAGITHTLGSLSIGGHFLGLTAGGNVSSGTAGVTFGATTLTAGAVTFDAATGTQLTLGSVTGTNTGFTVSGAGNTAITGIIGTGSGSVTKTGSGTLTFSGANTYTGATTINGGTLQAGAAGVISTSSLVHVASGAAFALADHAQSIGGLTGDGSVTLGSAALTTGSDNTFRTFDGVISGTGSLIKTGTAETMLTGANTFSGGATVTGGTLQLTGSGTLASAVTINGSGAKFYQASSAAGPAVTLTNGELTIDSSSRSLGAVAAGGGVISNGDGATAPVLTVASLTYSGSSTINLTVNSSAVAGLAVTGALTAPGSGTVTINPARLGGAWSNGTHDLVSYGSLSGDSSKFVIGTVAGIGSRQTSFLTNTGSKFQLTVGGDTVTYTGSGTGNWTTDTGTQNFKLTTAGTATSFETGDTIFFDNTASNKTLNLLTDISAAALTFSSGDYVIGSATGKKITGATSFDITGGSLTLNTANDYSGSVTLSGGTLNVGNAAALGAISGAVQINGGRLDNTSGSALTTSSYPLDLNGDFEFVGTNDLNLGAGAVDLGSSLSITTTASTLTIGGSIDASGSQSLTKTGAGTLRLAGSTANNYSGTTSVSQGTLVLAKTAGTAAVKGDLLIGDGTGSDTVRTDASGQIQNTSVVTLHAAGSPVFDLNGSSQTVGAIASSNTGAAIQLGSATLTAGAANQDNTFAGGISGTDGSLVKMGSGTLTLSGANSYTGTTTITEGTLRIGDGGTSGSLGSGAVTNDTALVFNRSNGYTVSNVISGAGTLTQSGSGTVTLSGTNTFTGTLNLNAGVLQTATAGINGSNTSSGIVFNGGTLQAAAGGITTGKTVTLTGAGTVDTAAEAVTLSGAVEGSGAFTKSGSGTLTLSNAANSFSGGITVTGGTLKAAVPGALGLGAGAGAVQLDSGAVLELNGAGEDATTGNGIQNVISGSGGITRTYTSGVIGLSLSGSSANTFTGLTTVTSGTLRLDKTAGVNAIGGDALINGGTLILRQSNQIPDTSAVSITSGTFEFAPTVTPGKSETIGDLSNSGGAFRTNGNSLSAGAVTLSGSGGVTDVNNSGSGVAGTLEIRSGLTFSGTGSPVLTVTSATGSANKLLLSSNITSTVPSGTAQILSGGTATNPGYIDLNSGTRTIEVTDGTAATDLLISTKISNGGLIKTGAGTLKLSGSSDYSGGTSVHTGELSVDHPEALGTGALNLGVANTSSAHLVYTGAAGTLANDINILGNGGDLIQNAGTGPLTLSGDLAKGSSALLLDGGTQGLILSGALTGDTFSMQTQGLVSFTGTLPESAAIIVGNPDAGGQFQTAGLNGNGSVAAGCDMDACTVVIQTSGSSVYTGVIGGTTATENGLTLTVDGTGIQEFAGGSANTFTGGTTVNGGTLRLNKNSGVNAIPGALTVNGGTVVIAGSQQIDNNSVITMTGGVFTFDGVGLAETVTSMSNSGGIFATGANTLTGTGNSITWSGGTNTVNAGVTQGGLLQDAHFLITGGTNTVQGAAGVTSGVYGGTLEVQSGGAGLEFGGTGSPALTLQSDATAAGRLLLTGNVSVLSTLTTGTAQILSGGNAASPGYIDLDGGNRTFTVFDGASASDLTVSAALTNGGFTKAGDGTMTLSGGSTFASAASVSAGVLEVTVNNALGTVAAGTSVTSGAALKLNAVNYSTAEPLSLNGSGISGEGALVNSGTSTYAGQITAATNATISAGGGTLNLTGGLVKNGTTLTLTGGGTINVGTTGISGSSANSDLVVDGTTVNLDVANTYNGPTYIRSTVTAGTGILNANVTGALPVSTRSAVIMDDSGAGASILSLGANQVAASLTGAADSSITLGSNSLTVGTASGSTTFAGVISGTGGLTKDAGSTLVLSGSNTYSGTTLVTGGTLLLGGSDVIDDDSAVTLGGGTFATGGYSDTAGIFSTTASSIIDLGSGSSVLTFANTAAPSLTGLLKIYNWSGVPDVTGGTDQVRFNIAYSGANYFTGTAIQFYSDSGITPVGTSVFVSAGGELVPSLIPVPEAGTTAGILSLFGLIAWRERRHFLRCPEARRHHS